MDAERKQSGVRSIPDKTSTGTRRPVRRTPSGMGRRDRTTESEAKVFEYEAEQHQVKGRKKKSSPPSPPRVRIEKTEKGKRWLSPGEVELHGDVLEVRDAYGKIVDSTVIHSASEEAKEGEDKT